MSGRKLRVLCLHGYQQDAATFRSKSGGFRKKTKSLAEYVIIDAPLIIDGNPEKRGWFHGHAEKIPSATPDDPTGLQRSLDTICEAVEKEGPFDGIFAFSQGASLASVLLHLIEKPQLPYKINPEVRFKFIVCACGLAARKHEVVMPITVPSLHLIGKTDQVVPLETARAFSNLFKCPEIFEYDGGHHVQSSSETAEVVRQFYRKFVQSEESN